MRRFSLRWLLLASVLGTITVAFSVFAIYLDRVERDNRIADIDAELLRADRAVAAPPTAGGPDPRRELAAGDSETLTVDPPVQLLLDADGAVIAGAGASNPFDNDTLAQLANDGGNRTTSDPRYRVRTTTNPTGNVALTALPLAEFDAAVQRFRTALAAGGAVILVLVAAVLWALTGFLTRPVSRLADAANRIAAGDLQTPVGPPTGPRETADLSVDLDQMLTRLREALDESDQARRATERLLADMAHEIRTPLTALKGYSDLYAQGMLEGPSDVERAMSRIGSESGRLNELASAMLQLAHEGIGRDDADDFDMAELAIDLASDLRAAYPEQRIDLDIDDPGTHWVNGSRNRMQQAILNLGSNACHHNPIGKPMIIAVRRDAGKVCTTVVDHGPGIDPHDRDRIFLPFYRADAARSRHGQHGAGLGLALAKQIAEQHDGAVSVQETPGGGATFELSLPASLPPPKN